VSELKVGDKVWVLCEVAMVYNHESLYVDIRHDGAVFEAKASDCRPVEPANSPKILDSSSDPLAPSLCMEGVDVDRFIEGVMKARGRASDPINPSHYKHLPAEAIDIIEAAIAKAPSNQYAFLQGQVIKYLLRCWSKKGIEDLRKAKWYLDRLVGGFDDLLAEASGANDGQIEPVERPKDFIEKFFDGVAEILGPSTAKRYRTPTLADLANGPIACEYRDCDDEQWRSGFLVHVLNGAFQFLCVNEEQDLSGQWEQCRIEVGE
jgi:hypothetical protein